MPKPDHKGTHARHQSTNIIKAQSVREVASTKRPQSEANRPLWQAATSANVSVVYGNQTPVVGVHLAAAREIEMGRAILLWLLGVPVFVIVLLAIFTDFV